jgi:nucleotide-binding universal stress UspA family protein
MSTIVVGVDGSKGSIDALRLAVDEARMRSADVKAVGAWHVPTYAYGSGWSVPVAPDSFRKTTQSALEKSLDEADTAGSGVTVTAVVGEGQAADVLCHEARDADLLVVGSRGLGGFTGLLLGSVSQQCAQHASCPVLVVPGKSRD